MRHIILIGGSGMLRGTCFSLNENGYLVTVIGRDRMKLATLKSECIHPDHMQVCSIDYRNIPRLQETLHMIQKKYPLTGMILWIRSDAVESLRMCLAQGVDTLHVRGISGYQEPWVEQEFVNTYRRVVLGYQMERGGSRWLTNEEIAQGVFEAYRSQERLAFIGQVEPYENRPE